MLQAVDLVKLWPVVFLIRTDPDCCKLIRFPDPVVDLVKLINGIKSF